MAWITALVVGFVIAPWVLTKLKAFKMAQVFRDKSEVRELADLHASKKHTPTMGGVIVYFSVLITSLLWAQLSNVYLWMALLVYTTLTLTGFLDDYIKITRKNSKGLKSLWKWLIHGLLTMVVLCVLLSDPDTARHTLELWVPYYKHPLIAEMSMWFLFLFFFVVLCGASNSINLTDGVDGLAIGCTITVALTYALLAYAAGNIVISNYLLISYVAGVQELAVVCMALVGAGLVFLWYNAHPAEVFMGDTGSLGIGGLIGAVAFMTNQSITLIIIGGIFVVEAMSVILQVGSFKLTGRRIFKMSPIHHHFELKGWHENKVVIRFWILSLIFAIIGLSSLKIR